MRTLADIQVSNCRCMERKKLRKMPVRLKAYWDSIKLHLQAQLKHGREKCHLNMSEQGHGMVL